MSGFGTFGTGRGQTASESGAPIRHGEFVKKS